MNQSSILYMLQNIDGEISKSNARICEIDDLMSNMEGINQAKARIINLKSSIRSLEKHLSEINSELSDLTIKQKTSENIMYGGKIQNPKELQDLQNEIDSIKKRIEGIQATELNVMISLETTEGELHQAEMDLVQIQSDSATTIALLSGEKSKIESGLVKAVLQREVTANSITPENLAIYERLYQSKRGISVSKIIDNACSACGTNIRPAEKQAASNPTNMAYCSSCGRILYSG